MVLLALTVEFLGGAHSVVSGKAIAGGPLPHEAHREGKQVRNWRPYGYGLNLGGGVFPH